jgi:anaerobic magnesium-protoporphyrin IX monomethyl ester cyclase
MKIQSDSIGSDRKFKVLLVYANSFMDTLFPVSISSISGALKKVGAQVECFDSTFYPDQAEYKDSSSDSKKSENLQVLPVNYDEVGIHPKLTDIFDDFRKKVIEYKPDLIGVSAVEPTYLLGIDLLTCVRDLSVPNIVGGVHAIFSPDDVMECDVVDMVCIGEGEACMVELAEKMRANKDYTGIKNIWVRKDGKVIKNEKSEIDSLDKLPTLDFTVFEPERIYRPMSGKLWRMVPIEFSRGCIYKCTYCSAPGFLDNFKEQGDWLRNKPMDLIFDEIRYYIEELNVEYFYFVSETFLAIPKARLDEFFDRYEEIKIPFWFNTRAETIKKHTVKRLEEVGCHRISIGLECGNEDYRRTMLQRPVSNEKTIDACLLFKDSPIQLSANNIIGYPEETRELIFDTIELNRQVSPGVESHSCSIFQPYRGTWLHKYCVEKGYWPAEELALDLNFEPAITYPNITHDEIRGLHRTFPFYIKFPKEHWPEIERAEKFTEEGDLVFRELHKKYKDEYYDPVKTEPRFQQIG